MRLCLLLIRTGTSSTYDQGIDEWLRDNHVLRDVNLITKTVELDKRGSADPGSRKVREMSNLQLENAGEALGKPSGFSQRDVGARSPQIELLCFVNCIINVHPVNIANNLYMLCELCIVYSLVSVWSVFTESIP